MRVEVKLLGMLKKYLSTPESMDKFISLNFSENTTVAEVLNNLGVPRDNPLLFIINGKETHIEDVLKEGDHLIICPPIYGG